MSISEFVQIFLSICGGVSIVGGAAAVIFKWITPAFRLNKRVDTLEEHDKRFINSGSAVNHVGQSDQWK